MSTAVPHHEADEITESGFVMYEGTNFSGRTDRLSKLAKQAHLKSSGSASYIGPEIYNNLSGLSQTVSEELAIHSVCSNSVARITPLLTETNLQDLSDASPFLLSGGEQVCLALTASLASQCSTICLDTVLEQLHPTLRKSVLSCLAQDQDLKLLAIADNRSSEYQPEDVAFKRVHISKPKALSQENVASPINAGSIANISGFSREILSIRSLCFSYGKREIVSGASVDLEPGKIYWLTGKNGAGKSTLAKLLTGVLRPRSGTLKVGTREWSAWKSPGKHVSYHFQNPDLQLFCRSVRDELVSSSRKNHEIAEAMAAAFGLTNILDSHPLDMPFVVRKRVALASTLSAPVSWFILDEPTLGQDDEAGVGIAEILTTLAKNGCGIIVITHSEWFRSKLEGRRLLLSEGHLEET